MANTTAIKGNVAAYRRIGAMTSGAKSDGRFVSRTSPIAGGGATHFLMKRLPLHVPAYNLTRVMNVISVQPLVAAITVEHVSVAATYGARHSPNRLIESEPNLSDDLYQERHRSNAQQETR